MPRSMAARSAGFMCGSIQRSDTCIFSGGMLARMRCSRAADLVVGVRRPQHRVVRALLLRHVLEVVRDERAESPVQRLRGLVVARHLRDQRALARRIVRRLHLVLSGDRRAEPGRRDSIAACTTSSSCAAWPLQTSSQRQHLGADLGDLGRVVRIRAGRRGPARWVHEGAQALVDERVDVVSPGIHRELLDCLSFGG
jgi:hypothetical protein